MTNQPDADANVRARQPPVVPAACPISPTTHGHRVVGKESSGKTSMILHLRHMCLMINSEPRPSSRRTTRKIFGVDQVQVRDARS
jgi:hypothetical protein